MAGDEGEVWWHMMGNLVMEDCADGCGGKQLERGVCWEAGRVVVVAGDGVGCGGKYSEVLRCHNMR